MLSQWGRVEDEATESMTPHKPAALSTQSGLLSPRQRGVRTPLLLVVALCVVQTLLLAVLGGGLTGARWTLERLDAALEGLDPAQLQALPSGLVDWDTLLTGHRLVSQEEEPDGLHTDAISFAAGGTYSRAYMVRAGGALTNTTVEAGTWATGSGVLSLLAMSGNSSGVGAAPEQRTLARQGAFVRIGNAATGEGELYVCLVGS